MILLGGMAAGLLFHRFTWADWHQPPWLEGDPLEVFTRVKIATEQPGETLYRFSPGARLGAPTGADWSTYPVPDRLVFVLTGQLSRVTGLLAAINLVGSLFAGLNAASFYLCARWLRCRWEWAAALGLVFAFCNYNVRWGITLSLSQTFVLPPLILLCAWAARNGAPQKDRRGWFVVAAVLGLWLGIANPYLAYFAGVVAGGALLLAHLRRNPWSRRIPLLIFLACLVGSFLTSNAGYVVQHLRGDTTGALPRNSGDFQVYALRPVEWFIPPADHRVPVVAELGRAYYTRRHGAGEFFYNYLGLLGVVGLAGLLAWGIRHAVRRHWRRLDPLFGLTWITAFGVALGINTWLGAVGFELFRASTRIGIFAHVWVLFFLGAWITRHSRRLARPLSILLAAVVAITACWEGTPHLGDRSVAARNRARWEKYQAVTTMLERTLPAQAAVFQLPVVPFPEAGTTMGMPDYEHTLPYLTSTTLRFSYGHLRQSPALQWGRHVGRQMPAADMVAALEQAGFSALWLDQRGYADRGQELVHSLQALGCPELTDPTVGLPVRIFRLKPADRPQLPDYNDPRLKERWYDGPVRAGEPLLLAQKGWYALEKADANQWHWALRASELGIWWEGAPTKAKLSFRLGSLPASTVRLLQDGRELKVLQPVSERHEIEISLVRGLTILEWRLQGATFKPGGADTRRLGFMVENLSVSVP